MAVFMPWVVGMALVLNLSTITYVLFVFRYSIYCGLGIGMYGILLYVPSLFLMMSTYFYRCSIGVVSKIRTAMVLVNAIFVSIVLFSGVCFSCVNSCVENFR